nr:hypothetical protein [Tanacetum cinerariifolium]
FGDQIAQLYEEIPLMKIEQNFRLSQAQILWGFYHRINVDFAYLVWEDFLYQVEHKNQKRSNEMYYPRFTKVIIDYFMTRNPSISRRNRINWHYVRDDVLFSIIKVVSRHQTTQQYGAILPIELTTDKIKNSKAYKEYYACATGEATPKPKASARKKKGDSASSTTPPTPTPTTTVVSAQSLSATAKGKQPARAITPTKPTDVQRTEAEQLKIALKRSRQETHISQQRGSGTDEGTGSKPGVPDTFKTLCLLNYALMIRHDYDITSSLRRWALQLWYSEPGYETVGSKDLTCEDWMVNTRTDADFSAAVQKALQTLLP